jgi:hypothetical protein
MAYTTIDDPSAHFHTQLYTGNGASSHSITNNANAGDFKPDWLWVKNRSSSGGTGPNIVFDTTRGNTKDLHTNNTEAEHTNSNVLLSFDTDGFSVGTSGVVNNNTDNFVAWQWKANGGTTSSNSDGSITSTVQANTTAGFSIVTYTGTQSNATVGHGLGAVPSWIITKCRSATNGWPIFHHKNTSAPETELIRLNETAATADNNIIFNDTAPTSTVFTVGANDENNKSSATQIAYCFAEKQGYSKFGNYTGNGNADGVFVYTGFKPAWIMIKRTDSADDWKINDVARDINGTYGNDASLHANENIAETTSASFNVDFLSNGFKLRSADAGNNASGGTYIYMTFAEHPFVSSKGVPVTAR